MPPPLSEIRPAPARLRGGPTSEGRPTRAAHAIAAPPSLENKEQKPIYGHADAHPRGAHPTTRRNARRRGPRPRVGGAGHRDEFKLARDRRRARHVQAPRRRARAPRAALRPRGPASAGRAAGLRRAGRLRSGQRVFLLPAPFEALFSRDALQTRRRGPRARAGLPGAAHARRGAFLRRGGKRVGALASGILSGLETGVETGVAAALRRGSRPASLPRAGLRYGSRGGGSRGGTARRSVSRRASL